MCNQQNRSKRTAERNFFRQKEVLNIGNERQVTELVNIIDYSLSFFFFFFFFGLFRAAPLANGSSQARGRIRAAAASLCHSHSNAGSDLHL